MNGTTILLVLFALGVIVVVTLATGRIADRQQSTAREKQEAIRKLDESAGIISVEAIDDQDVRAFLAAARDEAKRRLRLQGVSGNLALAAEPELRDLLARGVQYDLLLMDPDIDNWLFKSEGWIKEEARDTLRRIRRIQASLPSLHAARLNVRLYSTPPFQVLLFADDDILILSSYVPLADSRVAYRIRRGERSLYNLYDSAFRYLWERSRVLPPPAVSPETEPPSS